MSATSSAISTRVSLEVDELGHRRQDHRHVEPLVDAGVELDVHRERVLHAERVAERAATSRPPRAMPSTRSGAKPSSRTAARARARRAEVVPRHDLVRRVAHAQAGDVVGPHRHTREVEAGRVAQRGRDRRRRDDRRRLADALHAVGRVGLRDPRRAPRRPAACRARSGSGSR